jgi:hypothetical protein
MMPGMFTTSPFPGMDPWLETFWDSVHTRLVTAICDQIGFRLPAGLVADVEVSVYVLDAGEERGRPKPDVSVVRSPASPAGGLAAASAGVATQPYLVTIPTEPVRQPHVVIRSLDRDEPLVTAIELLSPTNKRKRFAREAYVAKRAAYRAAGAGVVEVDFARGGGHLIDVPLDDVPAELVTPYKACVRRATPVDGSADDVPDEIKAEYYPMPLRDRLPRIAVPLRATDPDVVLDLQRCVDAVYTGVGSYGARIDYARPLDPPLSPADAAWAAERVAAARATQR